MAKKQRRKTARVEESPETRRQYLLPILGLLALWVLMEALVNPRGEFPLNDDWCYARAAFTLLREHKLVFLDIVPMTLVSQAICGALFCLVLGPTFTALRLSTVALGFVGLAATYAMLREAGVSRWIAFFGCAVVALNPLYFNLSNTFMTDVPFSAFALVSLYLYVLALKRDSLRYAAAGTAMACVATLTRQMGVILPVAFMVGCLAKDGVRVRSLLRPLGAVVITIGVLLVYQKWLSATGRMTSYYSYQAKMYSDFLDADIPKMLAGLWDVVRNAYVYLGLFALPYSIIALARKWDAISGRLRRWNWIAAAASFVIVMVNLILKHQWMPLKKQQGDIIFDFGIGPSLLRDVSVDFLPNLPKASHWLWVCVSILGALGGALLVAHVLGAIEAVVARKSEKASAPNRGFIALILTAIVLYLAPIVPLTVFAYFDRYFVCAVPLMIILIALTTGPLVRMNRRFLMPALVAALAIGVFTVGAERDYLEWNRTRWLILDELMVKHRVPADSIDGGYEFNGWYHYKGPKQRWWRVVRDDFLLAFGPVSAFQEIERYPYRRWMPPGEGHILVLRKVGRKAIP